MTEPRPSLADRARLPAILLAADVAIVLGLPSERAGREFILNHAVPHARIGNRIYVLAESLIEYVKANEHRPATPQEIRERADEVIREIAPTARERQRGRKPPVPKRRGN